MSIRHKTKNNIMTLEELTQKMYNLIEDNVSCGIQRNEMYNLLDEIEECKKNNNLKQKQHEKSD